MSRNLSKIAIAEKIYASGCDEGKLAVKIMSILEVGLDGVGR